MNLVLFIFLVVPGLSAGDAPIPPDLSNHVTIYRDTYGVPHIVGDSEQATFFGYGYAQAQDHLERMMLQYRDAAGRLSEIRGASALGDSEPRFIPKEFRWGGDYFQRLMRTWQCVAENRQKIDPVVHAILDAFAQGVNYYVREHRADIPAWIDEISAVDIEALQRSNYMRFYSVDTALSKLPGEAPSYDSLGSNQFAIAPGKSTNGLVMHVENLHMPWSNHFQNYEAHLITPGKLDVAGISWFGSPFFLVGFNEKITWSATWNQPNIADAYEERINPANPREYLYDGHWRDIRVETASFQVKEADGTMHTIVRPLYYTHHGPVVRLDSVHHRAYSIKVPNFDGVNYSTGIYSLMKAESIEEFKAGLARQLIPRWNFLCSDSRNIYWVHNGLVPQRDRSYDWTKPVPGWRKNTEWGPYLPFSSNPHLENPPSGFLQNCNNPPWVATRNSGLSPLDPTSYYLAHPMKPSSIAYNQILRVFGLRTGEEALNARGERVFDLLAQPNRKFRLDEMVNMGFDTYVLAADVVVPLLDRASRSLQSKGDVRLTHAIDALRSWNRWASEDSYAFTYLFYWAKAYSSLYSPAQFDRFVDYGRSHININSALEQRRAWRALEQAVNRLQETFGKSEVRWGDLNHVVRKGTFPVGGTGLFDVLHPDTGTEMPNGEIRCDGSWGHLMIVMEGEPKHVWSLLPYGESEDPASPHYNDQAKLHSERRVKPFWFTSGDILKNTESTWGDPNRLEDPLLTNDGTGADAAKHTRRKPAHM